MHNSLMLLAYLLLLTGLTISAVAIYYSVVGLAAIFSAAVIPIYIMGTTLEVAKLVCASWLKANWERAPRFMKYYMSISVVVLMIITSMGIFGFLSKAHTDQNLVSGDVQSKIAVYDEKIKTERDNIDAAKKALSQMDAQVDQMLGRTDTDRGAERAVQIRRNQAKERAALQADIAKAQKNISQLQAERSPIAAEVRKVEAEVGPLKYIAKFIYGDKGADVNMLEKAVTWVIILIVIVFDPLAVIMLLAAQMTFQWNREQKKVNDEMHDEYDFSNGVKGPVLPPEVPPAPWPFPAKIDTLVEAEDRHNESIDPEKVATEKPNNVDPFPDATVNPLDTPDFLKKAENRVKEKVEELEETPMPIDQWNKMIEEAEKAAEEEANRLKEELIATEEAKKWAEENPQTEEAEKAKEWADEEETKKKELTWFEKEGKEQIKKSRLE
jgi:hypothetical protein